jgi:hypothetical protein
MKITSVSMNRPLNRAQGAIKKVSSVSQPLTMVATDEVTTPSNQEADLDGLKNTGNKSKPNTDTLGTEVDVWA